MASEQDRRALIAIVLSLGIYLLWTALYAPKKPQAEDVPADGDVAEQTGETPAVAPATGPTPAPSVEPVLVSAGPPVTDHGEAVGSDGWTGEIYSANGSLRDLVMTGYTAPPVVYPLWTWLKDKVTGNAPEGGWTPYTGGDDPERLLTEEGSLVLAGAGALDDDGAGVAGGPSLYEVSRSGDAVVATRRLPSGLAITKTYTVGEAPFTMDLEVRFTNGSSDPIDGLWVGVADRMSGEAGRFGNAPRPIVCRDRKVKHVYDLKDVEGVDTESWDGPVDWFGVGDRYFMSVLAPKDTVYDQVLVDQLPGGRVGSFVFDPEALDAGASRTLSFTAFIGPKDLELLKSLGNNLNRAVEFGIFGFFSKPLLFLLKLFHAGVGNWGVAIILLTVLVKLVFFPLTQKAFVSSRKMQAIQPLLKAAKEKYKDNRELQTQETMKIMKEQGVNPMGGCLPTLIQLPVWFALYNVMLHSVELYDTSFLYLSDLTAADPYGVLAVLYILLMLGQQKMMPMTGMDPTQQKIFRLMPLFFGFIMFGFPCGLVLYFSVNMMLTIVQQWFIRRSVPDVPAPATST